MNTLKYTLEMRSICEQPLQSILNIFIRQFKKCTVLWDIRALFIRRAGLMRSQQDFEWW